ncbi:purine nucleoside permease [Halovivax gelatinilyticus]|uniref:purine nucleoside permease n=1 Tax=Halovivax gelatinilyticus TaxID=2961597 RepID=UPI0020CA3971|nr:purine nucleoside permease [Halovivax gelatinilyticus]
MSAEFPTHEPLSPADEVRPAVVVLPAVAFEPPFDERRRWLDGRSIETAYVVPGADSPLYLADDGVAITTSGLGKAPAAATIASLFGSAGLDLSETVFLSAGIAGAPPARAALGSVFVADAILDWDRKHRWDPTEVEPTDGDDSAAVEPLAYLPEASLHEPNSSLVETARDALESLELASDDAVADYQRRYPTAPDRGPQTGVGPTITSDEFWHGSSVAREVESLCAAYEIDPYVTTQMEDAATAAALARVDAADRHLSLRAVANYDRPAPGEAVHDSFEGTQESVDLATRNVVRAGEAIVDSLG